MPLILKLEVVLNRLQDTGLKVNANKSFFAQESVEYLGYTLSREGIMHQSTKVEAIQRIAEPKNKRNLQRFIGLVNYSRDMWEGRSDTSAPLAALTSKTSKWKWTETESKTFQKMKTIVAREVLLAYPNFSLPFEIHTDASHLQLGAVISQQERPIAFYSRKLNPAQTRYTITERELLSMWRPSRNSVISYSDIL
jgi:RNase H-like domain found in reverse transcriptase